MRRVLVVLDHSFRLSRRDLDVRRQDDALAAIRRDEAQANQRRMAAVRAARYGAEGADHLRRRLMAIVGSALHCCTFGEIDRHDRIGCGDRGCIPVLRRHIEWQAGIDEDVFRKNPGAEIRTDDPSDLGGRGIVEWIRIDRVTRCAGSEDRDAVLMQRVRDARQLGGCVRLHASVLRTVAIRPADE